LLSYIRSLISRKSYDLDVFRAYRPYQIIGILLPLNSTGFKYAGLTYYVIYLLRLRNSL